MRIGMVTLRVRDLDKVDGFLSRRARPDRDAALGHQRASRLGRRDAARSRRREGAAREARNAAGLYHTAFLMPTRKDLARWLVHAANNKVPLSGFADHLVSESVYLDDPEGNGIEVYADRAPDSGNGTAARWRWQPTSSTSTACWR